MAVLYQPQYQQGGAPTPVNSPAGVVSSSLVIDGTPVRVAMIAVAAAFGLAALRWAGFRFNVGVS